MTSTYTSTELEAAAQAAEIYLTPLSETDPCGPNLEYDPEYAALLARMIPKGDVQYGDFVHAAEPPNWVEIERECRRMLLRTRDITILLVLLRCRIHLDQASGLREILALLIALLERYPEHLHPQLVIEGEPDPSVRANALAGLIDPDGVLGDLREIHISKNSAMRLQIRDVERAHATPKLPDALSPESVQLQLKDLYRSGDANVQALRDAAELTRRLQEWLTTNMREDAPDLEPFYRLMRYFQGDAQAEEIPLAATPSTATPDTSSSAATSPAPETYEQMRERILHSIRQAREWFERYEPSSPVPVLLRVAERVSGKRLYEVVQLIPVDLLERWSQDDQ